MNDFPNLLPIFFKLSAAAPHEVLPSLEVKYFQRVWLHTIHHYASEDSWAADDVSRVTYPQ